MRKPYVHSGWITFIAFSIWILGSIASFMLFEYPIDGVSSLLCFYLGIQFQWKIDRFIERYNRMSRYRVITDIVHDEESTSASFICYAYNKSQAEERFWEYCKENNIDVIGRLNVRTTLEEPETKRGELITPYE